MTAYIPRCTTNMPHIKTQPEDSHLLPCSRFKLHSSLTTLFSFSTLELCAFPNMISHYITNNKHISCCNPEHLPAFGVRWLFLLRLQTECSCTIEWAVSQQPHTFCCFCWASQAQITKSPPSMSAGCRRMKNAQHLSIFCLRSFICQKRRQEKTREDKRDKQMIK